jgi:hypothetical protein
LFSVIDATRIISMRNFQTLDNVTIDEDSGVIYLSCTAGDDLCPQVAMRREGTYVAVSANYGPLEIAMRLRFSELSRVLSRLKSGQGLQTTRQVGTGQAYLAMGLQTDGMLVLRPTILADATGYLSMNLLLVDSVRQALFDWLPAGVDENAVHI